MGPLSLHEISSERKGPSAIPSVWWVFLTALSLNVLTSSKLTNGMFKTNSLCSPWIYIRVPMCVLGHPKTFLLVLQKCTDLGYISKGKNYLKLRGRSCSTSPVPFVCPCLLAAIPPAASVRQAELKAQHITLCHLVKLVGECQLSVRNYWYSIEKHSWLQASGCTGTSQKAAMGMQWWELLTLHVQWLMSMALASVFSLVWSVAPQAISQNSSISQTSTAKLSWQCLWAETRWSPSEVLVFLETLPGRLASPFLPFASVGTSVSTYKGLSEEAST